MSAAWFSSVRTPTKRTEGLGTFLAAAETENTRPYRGGKWLSNQDSNQSMHFIWVAFSRRKTGAKLRRVGAVLAIAAVAVFYF
jgi:hypothetical protein